MTEEQYFKIVDYFDDKLSFEEEATLMNEINADSIFKNEFEFELMLRFGVNNAADIDTLNASPEFESADGHIERINKTIIEPAVTEKNIPQKKTSLSSWLTKHKLPLSIAASLIPIIIGLIFFANHTKNIKTIINNNSSAINNSINQNDSAVLINPNKNYKNQLVVNDTFLNTDKVLLSPRTNISISYNKRKIIEPSKNKYISYLRSSIYLSKDNDTTLAGIETNGSDTQKLHDTSNDTVLNRIASDETRDENEAQNLFTYSVSNLYDSIGHIKQQCNELLNSEKITLAVKSVNVLGLNSPEIEEQFTQMLKRALQNVNCFNVKSDDNNLNNITSKEIFSQKKGLNIIPGYMAENTEKAQVIVMGLITQISLEENFKKAINTTISGNKSKAHLSIIITLINAKTNEVIDSRLISASEKIDSNAAVNYNPTVADFDYSNNKLLENLSEKGIMQATAFIASKKDQMPLRELSSLFTYNNKNSTEIFVYKSDNSKLKKLLKKLSRKGTIVSKSINDDEGYIKLEHTDETSEIADFIYDNLSHKYNIVECDSYAGCGEIKLDRK